MAFDVIKGGYLRVQLTMDGKKRNLLVSVIVARAFLGPCPPRHECNHKNGDKSNNSPSNLEYLTRHENIQHSYRVLGRKTMKGSTHPGAKLTEADIPRIRQMRLTDTVRSIAGRFGVDPSTISMVCRRCNWQHVT